MHKLLREHIEGIKKILRKHKVEKMEVFGSIVNGDFNEMSDVDFLVCFHEMPLKNFAENFFTLEEKLQCILGRKVDILILKDVKNISFLSSISEQRKVIYEC